MTTEAHEEHHVNALVDNEIFYQDPQSPYNR